MERKPLLQPIRRWMSLAVAASALCLVLQPQAEAARKWKTGEDMAEAVRATVEAAKDIADATDYGFSEEFCILGAFIAPEGSSAYHQEYKAGTKYLLVGGGDADAKDVDLYLTDSDGREVARDDDEDATPIVRFKCKKTGDYTVHLQLAEAKKSSFCVLALLKEGGYEVPWKNFSVAVDDCLDYCDTVADIADGGVFHEAEGAWCLFGAILKEGEDVTMEDVDLEKGKHAIVGECDGNAKDIDLALLDEGGKVLAKDDDEDATPLVERKTSKGSYGVKIDNADSDGASFIVAVILDIGV